MTDQPIDLARAWLRANSPEAEGRAARGNPHARPIRDRLIDWHRVYAAAARELDVDLRHRGVSVALPEEERIDDLAESRAYAILSDTGDVALVVWAIKNTNARRVLRGSARDFLRQGALPLRVQEWLVELATWEERWVAEASRTEAAS